jgi:hypothetical protein
MKYFLIIVLIAIVPSNVFSKSTENNMFFGITSAYATLGANSFSDNGTNKYISYEGYTIGLNYMHITPAYYKFDSDSDNSELFVSIASSASYSRWNNYTESTSDTSKSKKHYNGYSLPVDLKMRFNCVVNNPNIWIIRGAWGEFGGIIQYNSTKNYIYDIEKRKTIDYGYLYGFGFYFGLPSYKGYWLDEVFIDIGVNFTTFINNNMTNDWVDELSVKLGLLYRL